MENFVLIKTFFNSIDAHNAKNHLESMGVFTQILGDINATSYNVFTQSNGGIRMFVHENDYKNALELLDKGV